MRARPKRFCAREGCPNRVHFHRCTYCSYACVPRAQRVNAGIKGRQSYARQQRAKKYGDAWERLKHYVPVDQQRVARDDFFAIMAGLCRNDWQNGYQARVKFEAARARRSAA